jgi:hypothetical protein
MYTDAIQLRVRTDPVLLGALAGAGNSLENRDQTARDESFVSGYLQVERLLPHELTIFGRLEDSSRMQESHTSHCSMITTVRSFWRCGARPSDCGGISCAVRH